jgi:hypothetical protein
MGRQQEALMSHWCLKRGIRCDTIDPPNWAKIAGIGAYDGFIPRLEQVTKGDIRLALSNDNTLMLISSFAPRVNYR